MYAPGYDLDGEMAAEILREMLKILSDSLKGYWSELTECFRIGLFLSEGISWRILQLPARAVAFLETSICALAAIVRARKAGRFDRRRYSNSRCRPSPHPPPPTASTPLW